MSYIGNTPTTQSFTPAIDYFSGNGSSTAFTLSRQVASVAQVQVTISNVPQTPGVAYTVSGNTITFTSAPPTGTSNIYVYYTSPVTQVISPGQQTVGATQLVNPTGAGNPVLQTSPTLTSPTITGAVMSSMASSVITSGTAVASTSGTSITFTGIPSWAKRITVMFNGVSTNGASNPLVQIGSGSVLTTGYTAASAISPSPGGSTYTAGYGLNTANAANFLYGTMVLTLVSGNIWISSHGLSIIQSGAAYTLLGGGTVSLSGNLDRVVITAVNGTDTFDAGSINILYE